MFCGWKRGNRLKVNGLDIILREPVCLEKFLAEHGYKSEHVAVEVNGRVVPKNTYEQIVLSQTDVIEVVGFVGGG